jgi:hypothetical protein
MVSRLFDRKAWSGPLGIARIVGVLSATWLIVVSFAGVVGLTSYSAGKVLLPMLLTVSSIAFMYGYQMGQSKGR